jgi:hypothetical protein
MSASSAVTNSSSEEMSRHHASENGGSEWATGLMMGVGDAQAETDGVWIAGTDLGQPVSARPFSACVETLAI